MILVSFFKPFQALSCCNIDFYIGNVDFKFLCNIPSCNRFWIKIVRGTKDFSQRKKYKRKFVKYTGDVGSLISRHEYFFSWVEKYALSSGDSFVFRKLLEK